MQRCGTVGRSANRLIHAPQHPLPINEVCQYTSHGLLRTYGPHRRTLTSCPLTFALDLLIAPRDTKPLAHPHWGRPGSRVHRIGLRVEHVQPAYPGAVPGCAVVVQPAVHDVHHRARAARVERGVRWTVGRAARTARRRDSRGAVLRHRSADRRRRTRDASVRCSCFSAWASSAASAAASATSRRSARS